MFTFQTKNCSFFVQLFNGFVWDYWAAGGNNQVGRYRISCSVARNIGLVYGHGNWNRYRVEDWGSGGAVTEYEVAVFEIKGEKIPKWRNFVQKLRSEQ